MPNQPKTLYLTDFVLARIADDEAAAHACAEAYPPPWDVTDRGHSALVRADEPNFRAVAELQQSDCLDRWPGEYLEHIARHDPARVLRECTAMRAIVTSAISYDCEPAEQAVAHLASIWADHPDYREEWPINA